MTTRTMACIDCGESLPYGRLSCPACGALLASVAGATRGPVRVTVVSDPGDRDDVSTNALVDTDRAELDEGLAPAPATEVATAEAAPVAFIEPDIEPAEAPAPEPDPVAPAEPEPPASAPHRVALVEPESPAVAPDPVALAEPEPPAVAPNREPEPVAVAAAVPATASPERIADGSAPARPSTTDQHEAILTPRPYQSLAALMPHASARRAVAPAAGYRPPTLALSAAMAGPAWTASTGTTGSGGSGGIDSNAPANATAIGSPADDTVQVDAAARYVEIAGWFVIVGAAMATLGFLLPWSRVVIGAAHIGGYFDSWGLASPTHMLVLAGLLVVLGLGIIRTPIPVWLRTGVLGLATGSLLIGLVWPYIVGPLGSDVGALVTGLGGLGLAIGGVLASWATRHALEEPSV